MKHTPTLAILFLIAILCSCTGCDDTLPLAVNVLSQQDRRPPVLLSAEAVDDRHVVFTFDEPVTGHGPTPWTASLGIKEEQYAGTHATIELHAPTQPGQQVAFTAQVQDTSGNSTWFTTTVWAANPQVPKIIINEFSTKGTDSNPDRVELAILSDGNLAGVVVSDGPADTWDNRLVLPNTPVKRNDMVVIYYKGTAPTQPQRNADGSTVYFWEMPSLPGLPGNNGCIVVSHNPAPAAVILDAVLYTNQTTTTHDGFGSRELKEQALLLIANGAWDSGGQASAAMGGINSTASTSTRTMARISTTTNSKTAKDWYVTVTRGATFGLPNTAAAYQSDLRALTI